MRFPGGIFQIVSLFNDAFFELQIKEAVRPKVIFLFETAAFSFGIPAWNPRGHVGRLAPAFAERAIADARAVKTQRVAAIVGGAVVFVSPIPREDSIFKRVLKLRPQ